MADHFGQRQERNQDPAMLKVFAGTPELVFAETVAEYEREAEEAAAHPGEHRPEGPMLEGHFTVDGADFIFGGGFIAEPGVEEMFSDRHRQVIASEIEKEQQQLALAEQIRQQEIQEQAWALQRAGHVLMTPLERAVAAHASWDSADRRRAARERQLAGEEGRPSPVVTLSPVPAKAEDPVAKARRRWGRGRSTRSEQVPAPEGPKSTLRQYLDACEEMGVQPHPEDVDRFALEDAADNGTNPGRSRLPAGVSYRSHPERR
jgi:hypothetical protein